MLNIVNAGYRMSAAPMTRQLRTIGMKRADAALPPGAEEFLVRVVARVDPPPHCDPSPTGG
jgi:hypothetical protein